jgi:hypothetical protein
MSQARLDESGRCKEAKDAVAIRRFEAAFMAIVPARL